MSFFTKLLGSNPQNAPNVKAVAKQEPKIDEHQQKKLGIEKAGNELDVHINEFDDKQRKLQRKVEVLKAKAMQLLQDDKKKQAKKYIQEASKYQKQIQSTNLRKKALVDKKFELQQAQMNITTIAAIQKAHEYTKGIDKYTDKMTDLLLQTKQNKVQRDLLNQQLKELVNHQQQDQQIDAMMKQLQIKAKPKIAKVQLDVQIKPKINTNQKKQIISQEDQIAKALAMM